MAGGAHDGACGALKKSPGLGLEAGGRRCWPLQAGCGSVRGRPAACGTGRAGQQRERLHLAAGVGRTARGAAWGDGRRSGVWSPAVVGRCVVAGRAGGLAGVECVAVLHLPVCRPYLVMDAFFFFFFFSGEGLWDYRSPIFCG